MKQNVLCNFHAVALGSPTKGQDSSNTLARCIEQSCARLVRERLGELKLMLVETGQPYQ